MEEVYPDSEYEKDNEIVGKLEADYKEETDPVKKAEKELYFHYMYEARRMKLRAKQFQWMINKNAEEDLLEETVEYIYVDHLLGGNCPMCRHDHMFAEKPWAEEMAKKLGKKTWKDIVNELEEDRKKQKAENENNKS